MNAPKPFSLFGTPSTSATATTGLFGQQPQQPAQNAFGGSLFGQQQQQQQPQQQQQQPQQQPSIFGSTTNPTQQPAQSFGAFGSKLGAFPSQQQQTFGGFGGSTLSQPSLQPNTNLNTNLNTLNTLAPQPAAPLFTRSTKFNDLPEDVRKKFEAIDAHIQGRVQISTDLKQYNLADEPTKGKEHIRTVHKDLVNAINKLRTDISSTRELNAKMDQSVQDTIVATRIIDGFRNPQQNGAYLKNYANFPLEYFTRVTEQLQQRLEWFSSTIEQIERKVASDMNQASVSPQAISSTLQSQHASLLALASKTAALDTQMHRLRTTYTQLWRARTGSARDPFNGVDRAGGAGGTGGGEFGMESLGV